MMSHPPGVLPRAVLIVIILTLLWVPVVISQQQHYPGAKFKEYCFPPLN